MVGTWRGISAVSSATVAAAAAGTAAAASLAFAGTAPITVRVEGVKHELLPPTVVHEHAGSLTRFGAPSGKCSDDSAAGALDSATHHNWQGTWESSFGDYEITSILGETHTFSSSKDYWEVFVNNIAAQTGACEIKLKPGEQILFAAVPQKVFDRSRRISGGQRRRENCPRIPAKISLHFQIGRARILSTAHSASQSASIVKRALP